MRVPYLTNDTILGKGARLLVKGTLPAALGGGDLACGVA